MINLAKLLNSALRQTGHQNFKLVTLCLSQTNQFLKRKLDTLANFIRIPDRYICLQLQKRFLKIFKILKRIKFCLCKINIKVLISKNSMK